MNQKLKYLQDQWGIVQPGARGFFTDSDAVRLRERLVAGSGVGLDVAPPLFPAQQGTVTSPNAGIPAFLLTFMDPELVEVIVAPTRAADIFGEAKRGDWEDTTIMFPMVEDAGESSAYGDDSENGMVSSEANWEYRQPFMYQTMVYYGELQMARAGKAKLDWAAGQARAAAKTMKRFENLVYFFGLSGLQNYGLLNDPALPASIVPATKAAGGTSWDNATTKEMYEDVVLLFTQAQRQTLGYVDKDAKMTLALDSTREALLAKATDFNVSALDMIQKAYKNLRIVNAPEYDTAAGQLMQLIIEEVDGQQVGFCSFTEKMRSHPIIQGSSSYKQKRSAGVSGAIIKLPAGIASMLGI